MKQPLNRVALAYSGGLDTSIIVRWLREHYRCQVVAVCVDVGQGEELEGLREKALASGACDFHVVDAREELVRDYLFPLLRAGAVYENGYLLGTSAARPLIARKQVEVALATGCDGVAHGCTGKGNDQVRFELAYRALAPELAVVAPWREWSIRSREDAIDYAAAHGIPVPVTKRDPYSRDRNLWHLSHEGGILEDPATPPEEPMFRMTVAPELAPSRPALVRVGFERGLPVAVDGEELPPVELVGELNVLGGRHGIGRVDLVENRLVGIKSRGVYETPGGTILAAALRALEEICLDRDTLHEKQRLALRYAELVYDGLWFSHLRTALEAFMSEAGAGLTGEVTLKLYKGTVSVQGRTSPCSLYSSRLASFDMAGYDAADAGGFIRLFGLKVAAAPGRRSAAPAELSAAGGRQ